MTLETSPDPRLTLLFQGLGDRYRFLAVLGRGGAGTVFEVENRALLRREAMKVLMEFLSAEAVSRFIHEARTTAALDHPNIVRIHDFGEERGFPWYAMQLVEGPSLSRLQMECGPFTPANMARIALPLLEALAYSHGKGVIHRDLKPGNILLDRDGHPFLTDFGIAKTETSQFHTRTGMLVGTPAYVAPEQAMGQPVDARADLYALATTLYQLVSGRLPFETSEPMEALMRRLQEEPEPLRSHAPQVPASLEAVIMRGLRRDRDQRWPSASAMAEALREACAASGVDLNTPFAMPSWDPPSREQLSFPDNTTLAPFDATADLVQPSVSAPRSAPWLRKAWIGAGTLAIAAGSFLAWRGRTAATQILPSAIRTAEPAPQPASSTVTPIPKSPAPTPTPIPRKEPPPTTPMPKPQETPVSRPVQYPQQLEAPLPTAFPATCGGTRVNLSLQVNAEGAVTNCRVLGAVDSACAEAARAYALRLRFRPALDAQGRPVPSPVATSIEFPEVR